MKAKHEKKTDSFKNVALERIVVLFGQAEKMFKTDKKLSNRYVALARKIAMRFKVTIPAALRKRFCKHCYVFLVPSVNARVRLQNQKVVYYCLECKHYMRFPYVREKKARKAKKN